MMTSWFNETTLISVFPISLPPFVEQILSTIHKEGYDIGIGGSFARNAAASQFSSYKFPLANDIDIFTNCPKDKFHELFPMFHRSSPTSPFYKYKRRGELPIDVTCFSHTNIYELIGGLDITLNTFFIDHKRMLHAPRHNIHELSMPTITLIDPTLAPIVQDPRRIFRLNHYSAQLQLSLSESIKQLLLEAAPHIVDLDLGRFESMFCKTLCDLLNQSAQRNLSLMMQLGIIGYLFNKEGTHPFESYQDKKIAYFDFCIQEFHQISRDSRYANAWYVLAMLALPYVLITSQETPAVSLSERSQVWVNNFLSRFITNHNHPKIDFLKDTLVTKLLLLDSRWKVYSSVQRHFRIEQVGSELSTLLKALDLSTDSPSKTLLFKHAVDKSPRAFLSSPSIEAEIASLKPSSSCSSYKHGASQ